MTGVECFCMWIMDAMFNDSQGPNKIYRNTILSKFRQLWAHTMCLGKTSPINMAEEKNPLIIWLLAIQVYKHSLRVQTTNYTSDTKKIVCCLWKVFTNKINAWTPNTSMCLCKWSWSGYVCRQCPTNLRKSTAQFIFSNFVFWMFAL